MLAQYVVDQAVVITWNTSSLYIGSWVDRDNTKTIYINPELKEETEMQMIHLVSDISHEIFHDLTPFNQKADTLYEEYWAFYVGACVSGQPMDIQTRRPQKRVSGIRPRPTVTTTWCVQILGGYAVNQHTGNWLRIFFRTAEPAHSWRIPFYG
jgi:hypothetical protein